MDYRVSSPSAYEKNKANRLIIDKTISSHFLKYFFSSPEPKAHRCAYSIPMVWRSSSSSVRRPLSTIMKHLLLQNCMADQSQILYGASLDRGYEILLASCGSHDQDGRHAHIW